jgi:hypothetical protein
VTFDSNRQFRSDRATILLGLPAFLRYFAEIRAAFVAEEPIRQRDY